ncbi:MAG TPA: hypothetical protein VGY55_01840 [Pirellulales bacterium]|nr:hypothetical protein [Pirellulales bacterium]
MCRVRFRGAVVCLLALGMIACEAAVAMAQAPGGARRGMGPPAGFRKLAPGVESTIPPLTDPHDTVMYHDVVELLAPSAAADAEWTPSHTSPSKTLKALSTNRAFRTTAWYLQFTFKPLRVIQVDLPNDQGRLERKTVWYMVYRVSNVGGHLKPIEKAADEGALPAAPEVEAVDDPGLPGGIHFFPKFTLEAEIEGVKKVYLDKIMPLAVEAIRKREDPNRRLLNSVEIGAQPIKLSTATEDNSVWGVATWVGVDQRIDFFSIYVTGLTNAYRWTDPQGVFKAGDPPATGRQFTHKTLQLNFWRPGDEFAIYEDQIYMGSPEDKVAKVADPDNPDRVATGKEVPSQPGRNWDKIVDYRWVFR